LELGRLEAIGFDDTEVLYWDHEILEDAVRRITDFLDNVRADTEDDIALRALRGDLDRTLEAAKEWANIVARAIETYRRQVTFRSQAFATVTSTLTEFRQSLRERLGKQNPEYLAIRWPMSLSPDEPIL
jgi:hypothetical protein